MNCVVPENSHTLPTEGNENSEGSGGVQKVAISDVVGWLFEVFFRLLRVRLVVVVAVFVFFQLTAVLLAKISDILLLTGVSKQEFLFSLLIR